MIGNIWKAHNSNPCQNNGIQIHNQSPWFNGNLFIQNLIHINNIKAQFSLAISKAQFMLALLKAQAWYLTLFSKKLKVINTWQNIIS